MFDVRCVLLRNTTGSHNKFYAMVLATHGGQSVVVKNYGPIGKSGVTYELYAGKVSGSEEYEAVWDQKVSKKGYSVFDEYNFSDELTAERIRNIQGRLGLSADGIAKLLKFAESIKLSTANAAMDSLLGEDPDVSPEPVVENVEIDKTTQYDNWGCW